MHPWHFENEGHFEAHCQCIERRREHIERGEWAAAVAELDLALEAGESPAHWNRALMLLALGRYARSKALGAGLRDWGWISGRVCRIAAQWRPRDTARPLHLGDPQVGRGAGRPLSPARDLPVRPYRKRGWPNVLYLVDLFRQTEPTLIASSKPRSPPTCRCRDQPSTSWSST